MIAVIADDFTGAAELAGISLRYGLKVELCVGKVEYKNADVLVVSTDSRSLSKDEAIEVTEKVIKQVLALKPGWIYKKIDSVLRGYVPDELKIQMRLMNKTKAFIMPANPLLGRTIRDGEYFINDKKINETGFADDPEFPVTTSSVKDLLNNEAEVIRSFDELRGLQMMVGEVSNFEDYSYWADKINDETVLAGAGDFFTALLNKYYHPKPQTEFKLLLPHLYVCGTSFIDRKEAIKSLDCVSYLPGTVDEKWLNDTGDMIRRKQKGIIAIDKSATAAIELRTIMAKAAKEIIKKERIKEVFIEGGSTAAAIFNQLNIATFEPINELQRGVVRMKAGDLFITVKPGSYELPQQIKQLYSLK